MPTLDAAACYRCRARLDETDFRTGDALRIGSLASCHDCAAPLLDRLTREQRRAVFRLATVRAPDEAAPVPTPRVLRRPSAIAATASSRECPGPPPRRLPWILAPAAAVPLLALVAFLASGSGRKPATSRTPLPALRPADVPPPPLSAADRPPEPERAALIAAITDLERETRGMAGLGKYQAALARLEAARPRLTGYEGAQAVGRLEREMREAVNGLYVRLKPAALDAQRRGDSEALRRFRAEVAAWGVRLHIDDLDKALADPAERIRAGLAGWWPLDDAGGTSVADASGVGRHGARSGHAVACAGRLGGAVDFSGSDGIVQAPAPPLAGPMTVAAWIRPSDLGGDRAILGEPGRYAFKLTGSTLRFTTPGVLDHDCPAGIAAGTWQHVAVTFQPGAPGGVVFYKDGCRRGAANASPLGRGSGRFLIGQNQWGASQAFHGAIDDVRVYNRALPPEEIRSIVVDAPAAP
jgi:hypothetical protein